MGVEGITILADAMLTAPVQTLTDLNLANNGLSQLEASTALSHVAAKYTTLASLRLAGNALGDAGVAELGEALRPVNCPDCALNYLDLSSCRVGVVGARHLLACLAENNTIRGLRLGDNYLDDTLDMTLVDALPGLHELLLTGNRFSHGALHHAAKIIARNRQNARDEEPAALRSEMHRLLFQETKLGRAREQVDRDEAEVAACQSAKDRREDRPCRPCGPRRPRRSGTS
eukprot:SRR837773.2811.p1 GENE.SRR837773.2811~~SRR837773.2811.p1  ORF type:complete len:241 (+),score=59.72 SRR837773.2811:34-723(+)